MAGEVITTGDQAQSSTDWLGWLDTPLTFLRQPWLIVTSSLTLLLLLLASVLLPQMPGQVAEDPVAATRWLNEVAAGYDSGALLRSLSLFSVLESTLFRLNAALLAILAAIHLADALALALAFVRLPRILDAPAAHPGDPLAIRFPHPIYRQRYAAASPPDTLSRELISQFSQEGELQERLVPLPFNDPAPVPEAEAEANEAAHGEQTERRWLALRQTRSAWLRPWLFAGLLLGLATLWGTVQFGWSVSPPALAPGESYINSLHDVALVHRVQQAGAENPVQSVLSATVTSESISLPIGQETGGQAGGAQVRVEQGPPALWMTAPDALFSLPGGAASDQLSTLGLAFPRLGSEQFVVLPAQNAGLRIVLLGNQGDQPTPSFLIEVYEGQSVQPAQRLQIDHDQELTVEVDGEDVNLRVAPTYALLATVERRPGSWLLWLALASALVGALGFLWRPQFTLAQIAPWPDQRSVVVVQSSEKLTGDKVTGNKVTGDR